MEAVIYLDTHVAAWLYAGRADLIPPFAAAMIDASDVLVSPMVVLELQYLHEVGKAGVGANHVIEMLRRRVRLQVCDLPFAEIAMTACNETWTRDPFDRIIVAQARHKGAPLITKDRLMRRHYRDAIWDRAR